MKLNTHLIVIGCFLLIFLSCTKQPESIYKEPTDTRIANYLNDLQNRLQSAPYGWNAIFSEGRDSSKKVFSWLHFDNKNRMRSGFAGNPITETSYRLKISMQPMVIFDTYNFLNTVTNVSAISDNRQFDMEYMVRDLSADTLRFQGRFNGDKLTMFKAAPGDSTLFSISNAFYIFINRLTTNYYYVGVPDPALTIVDSTERSALPRTEFPTIYYYPYGAGTTGFAITFIGDRPNAITGIRKVELIPGTDDKVRFDGDFTYDPATRFLKFNTIDDVYIESGFFITSSYVIRIP